MNQASSFRDAPRRPGRPASPGGPLAEGALFAGRYRVVRHIASGGMGAVYEVIHVETERRRALKVMHAHLFQSEEMCERWGVIGNCFHDFLHDFS